MNDIKIKQKSSSKPVISSKLPKAFSQATVEKLESKSPLKNEKKQTIKLSKVLKHLDRMPDQSTEKLFEPYSRITNTISKLPLYPVHLEDMITLSKLSSHSLSSTVRKVLHAHSLTLFSIKQAPISTRQERNVLRDWIEKWQSLKQKCFVKVIETFWNVPEGCVSIVSEYRNGGSLTDLCNYVGSIPEKPLSEIAKVLLKAGVYLKEINENYVGLSKTQVLFSRDGKIKISPGISKRIQKTESDSYLFSIGKIIIRALVDDIFEISSKKCCLFHSLEQNPLLLRISSDLQEFLCFLTSFENVKTISELLNHKWLSLEEYSGPDVELKELISIGFKGDEYWEAGDMQLNRICEALKVVLVGTKFSHPTTLAIENLAEDLGIPKNIFIERLNNVYNEISN